MEKPKKNFIYNFLYQMLIFIIPLITSPYLARTIGADGIGTYSYTYSIVHYFMLLTMLGVNNYGNRTIAKNRDNAEKLSKTFWSIYIIQLFSGCIMLLVYISYVLIFDNEFKSIAFIQSIFIISSMIDINWFFFGLEEFKKTISRSIFIKICNLVLIFILIKGKADVWKYAFIMAGMTCFGQIILWSYMRKKITFVKIKIKDVKCHLKPNLVLFIPVIAVSLYKIMDKIMLGSLTTVSEVGFYENAEKIINIPLALITALGTVMLPRMSNIIGKGDIEKAKTYILKSICFVMFLSSAMSFGLIAIGGSFAPFFFGKEFEKTGLLIVLLAVTLPFISFANVIRTQYLIPNEKDKIYIKSVFMGAIINLLMNFLFIPQYGSIGACYGTIAAEISVMIYQVIAIRMELPFKMYLIKAAPFLVKAIVMLIVIYPINYMQIKDFYKITLQIFIGGVIYFILNIKYILSIINLKKSKKVYTKT